LTPLLSLMKLNDPNLRALLQDWLHGVYAAADPADAFQQRASLPPGAYFVCQAGHVIGHDTVRFYAPDAEQDGMLARQNEIDNLGKQVRAQQMLADEARQRAVRAEAALAATGRQLQDLRQRVGGLTQSIHALQMEVVKLTEVQERYQQRSTQIASDLAEIAEQESEQQQAQLESEQKFEEKDLELAQLQGDYEDLQTAYLEKEQQLAEARNVLRDLERAAQDAQYLEKAQHSKIEQLRRSIATALEQSAQLFASMQQGQLELGELDDQAAQAERSLQPQRDKITELQLKEQAARLNVEQFAQQLQEVQADEALLAEKLLPDMRPSYLQGEVTRLTNAIAGLGAVNLAALDELAQASERKSFLDAQNADLSEAIATLEDAIARIDKETRQLLQDTFDQVNHHFSLLFPILFGGGQAKLIMTGDEILDSGVQVMAQPPGKKNATIHLLSGGEKALTATALVFSMFQLNPAPFCLLDEVDAPLDDSNTERFCKMVKQMSDQTQFLFISHNKIAMEMANQLIGVTMQEQGVSRIVAVDMEAAVGMVEAA